MWELVVVELKGILVDTELDGGPLQGLARQGASMGLKA